MKIRPPVIWIIMILALSLGIELTVSGKFEKLDRGNTDIYHILMGVRYQPKSTVIASLDAAALAVYPNTPLVFWGPHFALAIKRLKEAGALAIALDIHQAITPEQWLSTLHASAMPSEISDYDQPYDEALAEGRVILAASPVYENGRVPVPMPAEEYLAALPKHLGDVGLTMLPRDSDGKIRSFLPAFQGISSGLREGEQKEIPAGYQLPDPWWSFAALAVKEGFGIQALVDFQKRSPFTTRLINYCGPPKTIPSISLTALFREQGLTVKERALIAGRIVFIGADSENFGDHQSTPYSESFFGRGGYRDMSGVEIHANIAETILNPHRLQKVPLPAVFLLWGVFMAFAAVACELHIKPMALYLVKATSLLVLWPTGFIAFYYGYLLPQVGCFTSISLFFMTLAILRTLAAHDQAARKITRGAFDLIYHDRRMRRRSDVEIPQEKLEN